MGMIDKVLKFAFPNISMDEIKAGWVPVPAAVLEERASRELKKSVPGVEGVSLKCAEGRSELLIRTTALHIIKHEISVTLTTDEFEISPLRQHATVRALSDVKVESRNLFGWVCLAYVKSLVSSKIKELGDTTREDDDSLIEISFPLVDVRLDRVPAIRRLVDDGVKLPILGKVLPLEYVSFGPARITPGCVEVKLSRSAS